MQSCRSQATARFARLFALALTLAIFLPSGQAKAWNCVEYVREISSIHLSGNGWQWWSAAAGRYDRGKLPETKAIMVFNRTNSMRSGHVAVVSKVVDARTIEIDHANWIRKRITRNIRVQDVSPRGDWSLVRVWNNDAQEYGKPYPALGFIYAN